MVYYVAHRLFSAHDRALGARVAEHLAAKAGADAVFLPFCDTDEEDLVADVKGLRLYQLDTRRLNGLTGMIALLHGPSLDDGVCMEVGYAAALGVPVTILTTDFQTYHPDGRRPAWHFPDPLIEVVAHTVVRGSTLGPQTMAPNRFAAFSDRNQSQIDTAICQGVDALLHAPAPARPSPKERRGVHVETSPYVPDSGLLAAVRSSGHPARASRRFTACDPLSAAVADWDLAATSCALVADVSGPETPPGAAILIGAAAARRQRVIAYQPRPTYTHAPGREPNWRNLMIQYASDLHATTLSDVTTGLVP
ncbi:nucleoside 2-deoxyribosyltransferase [Streptomyces eurythermus]|uniref:nucleoside 2-deoxyribosyltransferase n=1 Tax=Streptomyces eurythermus TaxID=42237 RepID=UPI0036D25D4D